MTPAGRLYGPARVTVEVDAEGVPTAVEGLAVEAVREEWVVEDRWWTLRRLWRHYFELILVDGRNVVVFRTGDEHWYRQRA